MRCLTRRPGCSVTWLARLHGVQKVAGSNPVTPTEGTMALEAPEPLPFRGSNNPRSIFVIAGVRAKVRCCFSSYGVQTTCVLGGRATIRGMRWAEDVG